MPRPKPVPRSSAIGQQLPWWAVSFLLHILILFALSYIDFASLPSHKRRIVLRTDLVEVAEPEPITTRPDQPSTVRPSAAAPGESFEEKLKLSIDTPLIGVTDANVGSRIIDLFDLGATGLDGHLPIGGAIAQVEESKIKGPVEALDSFTLDVIEETQSHGRVLVVLLVDQSLSILDDRKDISGRMDAITETINKQMHKRQLKKLKWAMVSFGKHAQMCMKPSSDLAAVKKRILDISFDRSGKENLLAAVHYTLRVLANPRRYRLFIAAVTDEAGDDVQDTRQLESTLAQLKATKTRFYVFGREANFSYPRVYTPVRDEDGLVLGHSWADAGPETPEPELLGFDWRFNNSAHRTPSGFGMYAQTYLTLNTGGIYYIMADAPSPYDEAKLEDHYAPEVIPRAVYLERRKRSELRSRLEFIRTEWQSKHRPRIWFTNLDKLNEHAVAEVQKAQQAHRWVAAARRSLEKLKKPEKRNGKRWKANRDLTIAQLAKMQFLYRQYWLAVTSALRDGWPYPQHNERYTHFAVNWARPTDQPPGGRLARKELRLAKELLGQVARDYEGMPWGRLAKRDLEWLRPFVVNWGYYERPAFDPGQ